MVCLLGVHNVSLFYYLIGGISMTSEELQAKVSELEQQTEKNAKAIAKLKKQVAECSILYKF